MIRPAAALALMACMWVAGCAATSNSTPATSTPPTSTAPSPTAPSPTAPACQTEVAAAAFEVVQAQQRAFAAADFAAARGFASQGFRSGVTLREFQAIIEDGYAFLLTDPTVVLTECRMADEAVILRISIDTEPPVTLAYLLVQEQEGWRIDGASKLAQLSA